MSELRSSLSSVAAACREPDPAEALRRAKQAYRETEGAVVLINRNWLRGWGDRQLLEGLARKAGVAPAKRR